MERANKRYGTTGRSGHSRTSPKNVENKRQKHVHGLSLDIENSHDDTYEPCLAGRLAAPCSPASRTIGTSRWGGTVLLRSRGQRKGNGRKKSRRGPKTGETLKSKRLENVQRVPPKSVKKKGVWMLVSLARWHASCRLLYLTLASMTGYCIALTSALWLLD